MYLIFSLQYNHLMLELETATFAGGCFWCTEAVFKRLKGVEEVISGYTGGRVENPTYEQVSTGDTGHAEAIQIKFDPSVISYQQLVEIFFKLHDPTTLNQQGADIGEQYRSAIFYRDGEQKEIAEKVLEQFEKDKVYDDPIVTEISQLTNFYEAEDYHQDYYDQNRSSNSYCRVVIDPKIQKLYRDFKDQVREDE
jgi:peptide-methionine (S)-S-oxide reductase